MKQIKWKFLIITCILCLLPVLPGIALWNRLPDSIAIHFNFHNQPDNFVSKGFAVLALPVIMSLFQIFCCIVRDLTQAKQQKPSVIENIGKWIIPFISIILQSAIIAYALGFKADIRRIAAIIVGVLFIVLGKYLPQEEYIKNYNITPEKAKKINRFSGFLTTIMGVLMLFTLFMPPVATMLWLIMLIPYTIAIIVYSAAATRK